jgi:hypothetical protein
MLTKQELECLEMFQLYESRGADLILKTNVKKWEYKLYGGRPEFYPQDRRALFTMQKFRLEKQEHDRKHAEIKQRMQQKMAEMQGRRV